MGVRAGGCNYALFLLSCRVVNFALKLQKRELAAEWNLNNYLRLCLLEF